MKINDCSKCGNEGNNIEIVYKEGCIYLFCWKCRKCSDFFHNNISLSRIITDWNQKNEIQEEIELKNCPKCGFDNILIVRTLNDRYHGYCKYCELKGKIVDSVQDAKENWNNLNEIQEKINVDFYLKETNENPPMKINKCSKCGSDDIEIKYTQRNNPHNSLFHPYYNYYSICKNCKKDSKNLFSKNVLEAIENWNKENPIEEINFISQEDINKIKIQKNEELTKNFLEKLSDQIKEFAERGYKDTTRKFLRGEIDNYDWNKIVEVLDKSGFIYKLERSPTELLYIGWN